MWTTARQSNRNPEGAAMTEELVQALRTGDTARALALIAQMGAAGADLSAADAVGWTPAHVAAEYGHAGTIPALHAAGANLEAVGPMGWTPAHLAAQADHAATIAALHAAGANLNARDERGQTPIDLAGIHEHELVFNALFVYNDGGGRCPWGQRRHIRPQSGR
jgi:ankyrin repeat protein